MNGSFFHAQSGSFSNRISRSFQGNVIQQENNWGAFSESLAPYL